MFSIKELERCAWPDPTDGQKKRSSKKFMDLFHLGFATSHLANQRNFVADQCGGITLIYWLHGTFSLAWNLFPIIAPGLSYASARFLFPWLCRHSAHAPK